MALQFSEAMRNNRINQFEITLSTSPKLRLMSGPPPANCAAGDTGILLCEMTLPSDWLTAAAGGTKSKVGTWSGFGDAGAGGGTAVGHFRLKFGSTTHCQGTVSALGGGGNMTIDSTTIVSGQAVTVVTFQITDGNA